MQEIQDLIPKLAQLKGLYQQEDFQVLLEFLLSSQQQLAQALYTIDFYKEPAEKAAIKSAVTITQINLIGTILLLPKMVEELKRNLEAQAAQQEKIRLVNRDEEDLNGKV